jgi:thiaminase/transcriptional activator TenA
MFAEHAANAVKVERALHEGFFQQWGMTPATVAATPPAPTNLAYTSYLLAVAYGAPFPEAVAALLPCYWIYWEVGKVLERIGSPVALFQRWIGTYASAEFGAVVRGVLEAADTISTGLSEGERGSMRQRFVTTSRYEWMFWDMAYRREGWPV